MTNAYSPVFDRAAGLVHIPVLSSARRATMRIEAFESLRLRGDLLLSPMRPGNDHGAPAIRCKVLDVRGPDTPNTQAVAAMLMPPGRRQKTITKDGDPFNLLPENLVVVDLPQFPPATAEQVTAAKSRLLTPVRP